jgi:predicted MFS family arabinose efflux permease
MQARLARRMPPGSIAVLGLLVMLIGISATTATVAPVMPALLSIGTWGIAGCGIGLAYSALSLAMLQNAAQGHEGRASSALQIASQLGSGESGITVAAERVMLHFVLMIVVTGIAILTAWRVER